MTRQEFEKTSGRIRMKLLALAGSFISKSGITDDADDIVQESMLKLWQHVNEDYPIQNLEAFAVTITKKVCLSHLRDNGYETESLSGLDAPGTDSATIITDEADIKTIKDELYSLLTPTQKYYLHLRNDLGLSLDEIADVTGNPKSSIKTTISIANRLLMEQIKRYL